MSRKVFASHSPSNSQHSNESEETAISHSYRVSNANGTWAHRKVDGDSINSLILGFILENDVSNDIDPDFAINNIDE